MPLDGNFDRFDRVSLFGRVANADGSDGDANGGGGDEIEMSTALHNYRRLKELNRRREPAVVATISASSSTATIERTRSDSYGSAITARLGADGGETS